MEYEIAIEIPKQLKKLSKMTRRDTLTKCLKEVRLTLNSFEGIDVEYLDVFDDTNLRPCHSWDCENKRVFVAAHVGEVRLIDNMSI